MVFPIVWCWVRVESRDAVCSDQLELYMQGQEKAILDDNETEDHDPTTHVIGLTLSFLSLPRVLTLLAG